MSLQAVIMTLGIGVAAVAAVAYVIFSQQNQQRYKTTNQNAYGREFRVIQQDSCGVCLEDHSYDQNILNCGHWIHRSCLNELKQNIDYFSIPKCPFCRTPIH